MARANGEGTVYRRQDGRWTGAVYVYDAAGGRRRRQVYGKTRAEAAAKVADLLAKNRQRIPAAASAVTVDSYGTVWLARLDGSGLKPATVASYRWILDRFIRPRIGRVRVQHLTPEHVRDLLAATAGEGVSARTVQLTRATLRVMLAEAERDQIVQRNVAGLVRGPRVERVEVEPWTAREAADFLRSMDGHRLFALFAVGVSLGLRKGELLALRWEDVDLTDRMLRVRRTVQRVPGMAGLVTGTPKTARSRRAIPLPGACVSALIEHKRRQDAERKVAAAWVDPGLVFATTRGSVIEPRNINRLFEEQVARAGLRRIRFHDLRHTCASLLLAQGVPPRVVMEVLGHSQLSITTDLYGHVMPTGLRAAADAMEGVFQR